MHRILPFFAFFCIMLTCQAYAGAIPPADAGNPIADTLCNAVGWFTRGGVGAGLASISIMIIGFAAVMNKISWGMAIFSLFDVALIFGAAHMVEEFGGKGCISS